MKLSPMFPISILVLLGGGLSGCTQVVQGMGLDHPAPPRVRWIPAQERGATWRNGLEFVAQESSGVRVEAAFEEQNSDRMLVRVRVINDSAPAFDVEPAKIACNSGTLQDVEGGRVESALDPEVQLQAAREREKAYHQSTAKTIEEKTELEMGLSQAVQESKFWSEQALRRNTLGRGQTSEGIVVFALAPTARDIRLSVPLAGRNVELRFQQVGPAAK